MKITKDALGQNIKALRKKTGLTQDKLAERVDIDPKHLSRIETGRSFPSIETMMNIADALNVEVQDLFVVLEKKNKKDLKHAIDRMLKRADVRDLELILKFIRAIIK